MLIGFFLFFMLFIAADISVHGQLKTGFISIDCGSSEGSYYDYETGTSYNNDRSYIDTGINKNISSEYAYPNNPNLPYPLSDLRTFPQGNKNCYTFEAELVNRSLILIRATFLYGNYDGENKLPEFDLYLGVNLWTYVKFKNASEVFTTEIISTIKSNAIYVCLLNKGLGTPFISALELRPLNISIYSTEFGASASLVLFERLDIGSSNGTGRYKDDIYDRIWSSYISPSWDLISTSSSVNVNEDGYRAPFEVISTAARPQNESGSLELYWNTNDPNSEFYVYLYFAEIEQLGRNETRKFNISWNGVQLLGNFVPRHLYATTFSNSKVLVGTEHRVSIYRTRDSTGPPILNAAEVYIVRQMFELPTYHEDIEAIMNIKSTYRVQKFNWAGDPCRPKNYSWEGLKCNYNSSLPRIISLNLTSSNLTGIIVASIAKLSLLESLDLSNNNLTGSLPGFLEELKALKSLRLKGNQLSNCVPSALVKKSKAGLLELSVDDQNLCSTAKKKIIVPIVASISSTLVVLTALIIIWKLRKKSEKDTNKEGRLASRKIRFTYAELLTITSNFQTLIGKGGFGSVFLGQMDGGTQVAIKILSPSSSQGFKEFQTEAELLMRIHHRNLVCFVGYCDEGENLALIYEYMTKGNLRDYLKEQNSNSLSWEMRLHIAIDAAQGLEYLHHGCKPPIVHIDVKSANILLSENLEAKIADFGLSRVFPADTQTHVVSAVMGTTGYLDPEYYVTQKLNEKSDVYSFGIVLLELITGQPAIIKGDEPTHILHWISPDLKQGNVNNVVDQRLKGEYDVNSMWNAMEVAMACTTSTSISRADMTFVVVELKECLAMELARCQERTMISEELLSSKMQKAYSAGSESPVDPSPR